MEIGNGANKAPLLEKGSSSERWHKLKLRFSVLKALDTKNFMEMQAKIFTAGDVADDYPFASRLMTRVNTMASIIAPEEIEPVEDKDNALQTNEEAIVNLLNNCLGSGMLTMGFAIAKAGIIPALCMMALSAFLNRFTLLLNLRTCKLAGCDPASSELGEKAFGSAGRVVLILLYTVFGFLCCVSYVDAAADSVGGFASLILGEEAPEFATHFGVWAILLFPTTLIRSLKAVAMLSFVAFVGGVVMLVAVTAYSIEDLLAAGFPALTDLSWSWPSFASFTTAFPILLLIFSIQAGGGVVLATMRDTSEANVRAVSRNAYLLVLAMDAAIGLVAYVAFLDDVQGNVLLNFSAGNPIAMVARFALLDLVVLSYMIMMIPCKLALIDLFFGKNEARMEATTLEFYSVTFGLNILAIIVALGVSDLSLINGLNGALCTNLVAFVLPPCAFLKIRSTEEGGGVPVFSAENLPYLAIIAFGLFSLTSSSYTIVQRFME